jgi:hypothetical protein
MTGAVKTIMVAFLALMVPPLVAIGMHWDKIVEWGHVDPATAEGHVVYFTAPG